MSVKKIIKIGLISLFIFLSLNINATTEEVKVNLCTKPKAFQSLTAATIANELGWVISSDNRCHGYYLEAPFLEPGQLLNKNQLHIKGDTGLFSLHGTSTYEGNVIIFRDEQQIITNKAYVYRDSDTEELSSVDLIGNVIIREPNTIIRAYCGNLNLKTESKSLNEILYRTAIYSQAHQKPTSPTEIELQQERKVYQLSAWGRASQFSQTAPRVYEFKKVTYTTCPPLNVAWEVKADDIVLNKETGRGSAKNAKVSVKGIPIFYSPTLNFPIDQRRQSGFLWPKVSSSSTAGPSLALPFYWNIAPNYDDTITPAFLEKRGVQLDNLFRYLIQSPASRGEIEITLLPNDRLFQDFKKDQEEIYQSSPSVVILSELRRLENASNTRDAVWWKNYAYFNEHWSWDVDYSHVSDDYYLKDFGNSLEGTTPNQLLQQTDLYYKGQYWHLTGRLQGYQTLHPIAENNFFNQYKRLPQFILEGEYPDEKTRLNYFLLGEFSHFAINNNPGNLNPAGALTQPIGNRYHIQPGFNFPFYRPAFYINPRIQFAMTKYGLEDVIQDNSSHLSRALPIFDVHSGLFFERPLSFFNYSLRQTLEPQIYYTYVPFRNQNQIPIFDTTENTLTYDQLFTFNRFSGLDRIGDANQISVGVATRFIDQQSGFEKISAGIGQIIYFANRRVTLCDSPATCTATEENSEIQSQNTSKTSPLSGVFTYNLTPYWSATANIIWDTQANELNNQTFVLQYIRDAKKMISLTYSYVQNGDPQAVTTLQGTSNNLSQTDFSFSWPIKGDFSAVGRWTENWNRLRFQNLLYGIQYDSCCWAIRFVAGRTFDALINDGRTYQYNTEFYLQFALKGLGSFGSGSPGRALNLSSITSETSFGQDF